MMLAIYLTAPEIENDRRALNTLFGMRRAKKEGRWMGQAPIGYINLTSPNGKRHIAPNGLQAKLMAWAFNQIALAQFSTEQIFNKAKEMGLQCNKNRFLVAVRDPVYCGKIRIAAYGEEKKHTVAGQHAPIITEQLFLIAQKALDDRKRTIKTTISSHEMIPLRGFLQCSKCSRTLTASGSKGRNNYYYYYHCSTKCGYRIKAAEANEIFFEELCNFVLNVVSAEHFKNAILDGHDAVNKGTQMTRVKFTNEIGVLNKRIASCRELLLSGDFDANDFRSIKQEAEHKIEEIQKNLAVLPASSVGKNEIKTALESATDKLMRLDSIYFNAKTEVQRKIIGSMYPEKFTFENLKHRTAKRSYIFSLIYQINSKLQSKKNGQATDFLCLPTMAPSAGLEPATL